MKLSPTCQRWLKLFHIIGCSCWLGGAVSLLSLYSLRIAGVLSDGELYGIDRAAHAIDSIVVVYSGATLSLVTGLLFCCFTGWGFFRHRWIIWKWLIALSGILFGTFALGPWEQAMLAMSKNGGMKMLSRSAYLWPAVQNGLFGLLQVVLLILAIWLSIAKPWNKKTRPQKQEPAPGAKGSPGV